MYKCLRTIARRMEFGVLLRLRAFFWCHVDEWIHCVWETLPLHTLDWSIFSGPDHNSCRMWQTESGPRTQDGNQACYEPTIYSLAVTCDSGFWLALPTLGKHIQRPYSNTCYTHCFIQWMGYLWNIYMQFPDTLNLFGFIGFVGFGIIVVQPGGTSYDQGHHDVYILLVRHG